MHRFAFGEYAARWLARVGGDAPIVACEPRHAPAALAKAVDLRRAGQRFAASVSWADPRLTAIRSASVEIVRHSTTLDEVRAKLDAFAAERLDAAAQALHVPVHFAAVYELIRLADRLYIRSWAEYARLRRALGTIAREAEIVVADDLDPAAPPAGDMTDVVVWNPRGSADSLGIYFAALQDLELPVTLVARDPAFLPGRIRVVDERGAAAALARARIIIDATRNDPSAALGLARTGRPLAVTADGGGAEFLHGVGVYDPWSRRSILAACADALGTDAPGPRAIRIPPPRLPTPPIPHIAVRETPLVSIIIATFNRPAMLGEALASIARQSYPAIETIVVNDGGQDLREVVEPHPRARLIQRSANGGPAAARNDGLRTLRGDFVTIFDDDDEMFPEHVATLVAALDRSGLDGAYGQMINRFLRPDGAGGYTIDAYLTFDALLDHADISWGAGLAVTAIMVRRAAIERAGPIDESLVGASDYEYWIRLSAGCEWVRVPEITSIYNWRLDGSNLSGHSEARFLAGHRQIYEKHPTTRPLVAAGRAELLVQIAARLQLATPRDSTSRTTG